jgi:WD40 repeat protein
MTFRDLGLIVIGAILGDGPRTLLLVTSEAPGGSRVGEDNAGGRGKHRASMLRRQVTAAQPVARDVTVSLAGQFRGDFPNAHWLAAAWSPDGAQLAFGGRTLGGAGVLQVWNAGSGRRAGTRPLTEDLAGAVVSLAWSPDGGELATVEADVMSGRGRPVVRVRSKGDSSRPIDVPGGLPVTQVAWSPDGSVLALSGPGCAHTLLVDAETGAQRLLLGGVSGPVAFAPDRRVIAGIDGTSVVLCAVQSGQRVRVLAGQQHVPAAIAWARRGKYLAVADGQRIHVWDAEAGTGLWDLPWAVGETNRGSDGAITALDWLDDGHYLLEFRRNGAVLRDEAGTSIVSTLTLWDTADGSLQFAEKAAQVSYQGRGPIGTVALSPDGGRPGYRSLALALSDTPPVIWGISGDLRHYRP